MMKSFFGFLKTISTEDDANRVYNPVRVVWLFGAFIGVLLGVALFIVAIVTSWMGKDISFVDMGTGFAAWLGGLGVYVTGGAAALWAESKTGAAVTEETRVMAPPAKTKTVKKTTTVKDK